MVKILQRYNIGSDQNVSMVCTFIFGQFVFKDTTRKYTESIVGNFDSHSFWQ